jgi:tRNA(Met) C34 N-acetyltransferase TmcA
MEGDRKAKEAFIKQQGLTIKKKSPLKTKMPYDIITGRNESDKAKFGQTGLATIGKSYVTMATATSLSNPLKIDVARSHVILVAGKRGSGKSYTLGVIAEELANLPPETAKNLASLVFDTMGIFWTMKFANEKDTPLLQEWDLKTKSLPVNVFVPFGKIKDYQARNIPFDKTFALLPSELQAEDWLSVFNLEFTSLPAVLLTRTITHLHQTHGRFTLTDIVHAVQADKHASSQTKEIVAALLQAADT